MLTFTMLRWVGAFVGCALLGLAPGIAYAEATPAPRCAALAQLVVPGAQILSAERVDAGKFAPQVPPDLAGRASGLPAFCRITARATPTVESRIGIEIWLPLDHWNGRYLGTGNGGPGAAIAYGMGMIEGLKRGFAVANTDLGTAPDIAQAADQPERWADFGYRATHEMTRVAKAVVGSFYRTATFHSYFEGCSTGGQQALVSAQRFPDDYDGILAGDPGSNRTHSTIYFLWNNLVMNASPEGRISPAQWAMVTRAVLGDCGGKDGGAPGDAFLTDPQRCRFDPASLPRCGGGSDLASCFTPAQIAVLQRLYAGAVNPRTGERIYPGLTPGSEMLPLGPAMMADPEMLARLFVLRWAFGPSFSAAEFDFDHGVDRLDARLSSMLNANSSDLGDFARRGGKLILYSGLADPGVPFPDVVSYYDRVVAAQQATGQPAFARLFLVPGMGHCFGGPGVTDIGQPMSDRVPAAAESDILRALVAWTETPAPAPVRLVARKSLPGAPTEERPICAYPAIAEYRHGDPRRRESFSCVAHPAGTDQAPAARYLN